MSNLNQTQVNYFNKPLSVETDLVNKLSLAYSEEGLDVLNYFNTLIQRNSLSPYITHIIMNVYDLLNSSFQTKISYVENGVKKEVTDYGSNKFISKVKTVKKFILLAIGVLRENCSIDLVSVYEAYEVYNNFLQSPARQLRHSITKFSQITYVLENNNIKGEFSLTFKGKDHRFVINGHTRKHVRTALMERFMEWYNFNIANVTVANGQMEESGEDASAITGSTPLQNDVSKETVITSDVAGVSTMDLTPLPGLLRSACAGSIISEFDDLTERWLQIDNFRLVRDTGVTLFPWRSLDLPKDVLQYAKNPNVLPFKQYKLAAPIEMEVKIKINSNKFNQGRLVISYLNDGKQMQVGNLDTVDSAWKSFRTVYQAIQRDHVMLDLNESNEVTLKIPFLSPKNFIPIYNSLQEYPYSSAVLDIHVISALRVPDEAQSFVNGLIFIRFPKLAFTALQPSVDNYAQLFADGQMEEAEGELPILPIIAGAVLPALLKPIATGAGNLITGLINKIPFLGGMFKTSPVLGDLNSKRVDGGERDFDTRMQFLNADKPANHNQPMELRPNAVGDMAIGIKTQPQFSMRLDCSALTPQLPIMYPSPPVQSIFELNRIWNYVTSFNWSATQQTVGEEIFSLPIHPLDPSYVNTTFGTYGHMYHFYSGSIEYRFEFVATQFHTGACSIGYVPFVTDFNMEDSKAAFYKMYDLREERQVGFHVPYIDSTVLRTTIPTQTNGVVKFFVQNPLVPIGSVTQEVQVLVFARFGEDAHYSYLKDADIQLTDGQMDQGEQETNEPTSDFGTLQASGIVANIGEDHELIHDIIKRYVKYTSLDVTGEVVYPIKLNTANMRRTNSMITMQGFRFVRGSYTLTLVIEKKPQDTVRFIRNRDVSLIPINGVINTSVTNLPVPQSIGSITETSASDLPAFGSMSAIQSTFSLYQDNGGATAYWTANDFPVLRPNDYVEGNLTYTQTDNRDFEPITTDGVANVATVNGNNNKVELYNGNIRTALNYDTANLRDIKTAMDTNTGINTFNSAVNGSFNQLNGKVNDAFNVINTNSTNTNTNNSAIVAAIDEGSGGVIAAELPTQVTVAFKPLNTTNYGFFGSPNQIVLTNINQTMKINIPFYSMYNYQDHHYKLTTYPKEFNVVTMGDLVIRASDPISVDMYWSAGDDFYPSKFIGIPQTESRTAPALYLSDGQMEQLTDIAVDAVAPKVSGFWHITKDRVYNSALSMKQTIARPVTNFNQTLQKYDHLADTASDVLDTIKDTANKIMEYLVSKFKWLAEGSTLASSLIHLIQALINPTLPSVALAISGILVNLGLATFEVAQSLVAIIVKSLSRTPTTSTEQHTGVLEADGHCEHECSTCERLTECFSNCKFCSNARGLFDKDTCATLAGLILSSISVALGLKSTVKTDGVFYGLFKLSNTFWSSLNGSVRFLKDLFKVFDRIWKRIVRTTPDGAMALALTTNRADIIAFVKESQAMLSILNDSAIATNSDQKRRFWLLVAKAYSLQSHLIASNQPERRPLLLQCEKVIRRANEIGNKAVNCPVRYEPFVIGLKGESKLGKSFLLNALLPDVLSEVYKYSSFTPPIYVRSPGTEYWNGYTEQPAIVYDDFLACTEPTMASRQITELFGLKSSAIFNCNMANLEDKEKNANPFIVALAMNKAIVPNGITEPEAFLRRKDSFWIVKPKLKEGQTTKSWSRTSYTEEEQKNFEHLEFCKVPVVTNEMLTSEPISYVDFKAALIVEARKYHEQEVKNVNFRFDKLKTTLPLVAQEMSVDSDPFAIFYASCMSAANDSPIQTGLLPSELMLTRLQAANNATAVVAEQTRTVTAEVQMAEGELDLGSLLNSFITRIRSLPYNFKKRLFAMVHGRPMPELRDPVYGHCSACLNDNIPLVIHCDGTTVHGYCSTCLLAVRNSHPELLYRCPACRRPMEIAYDPALAQLGHLMRAAAGGCARKVKQILSHHNTYIFLAGIGCLILDYYLYTACTLMVAEQEENNQHFIHDVFKQQFYGGIDTKFGFSFFNPHKNAPQGECGTSIYPVIVENHDKSVSLWNYVKVGQNEDNTVFGIGNPFDHVIEASNGEVDAVNETEMIENLKVTWYPAPAVRNRAYGDCTHNQLLVRNPVNLTFEWDTQAGYGTWHDEDGNIYYDSECGEGCVFTPEARRLTIRANITGRAPTYKLMLVRVNSGERASEDMIPRELLNLDYLVENQLIVQRLVDQIEAHQSVSLIDRLKGVFLTYGRGIAIALACGAAIVSFVVGANQLMKYLKHDEPEDDKMDGQLTSSGDFKTMKLKKVVKPAKTMFARGQCGNSEHQELAIHKVAINTMIVTIEYITRENLEKTIKIRCLGLFGRTCIMTRHEMMFLLNNQDRCKKQNLKCKISLKPFSKRGNNTSDELEREIVIEHTSVKHFAGDFIFWELPVKFPQFKDITNLIASRAQHATQFGTMLMVACDTRTAVIHRTTSKVFSNSTVVKTSKTDDYDDVTTYECYQTNYSRKGYCGSIGMVESNNPILCYHFSGREIHNVGFALPLVKEDIQDFRSNKVPYSYMIPELAGGQAAVPLEGDYWSLGLVGKELTPYLSSKSKIMHSKLNGKIEGIEVVTQPGILSASDSRYKFEGSPLKWGCQKHLSPPIDLPTDLINQAASDMRSMINEYCEPIRSPIGKLDLTDAVLGMDNLDYYDPIKLDTSSGYPYNLAKGGSKKSNLIRIERNESNEITKCEINRDLIDDIERNNEMREAGNRPFTVFQDTLKDERRKASKLEKKDGTRVFSQSPVDFTISTRQYYLDFAASYMKNRFHLEHAVGINVNSEEWTQVAQKLLSKGNNIISGDFTDFGPRIWRQLVIKACELIDDWYNYHDSSTKKEHSLARNVIAEEIATTYHICNNHIYMVYCGIPSGHALTTILNSMVHLLLIRICWLAITKTSLEVMKKSIAMIVYGDDHLISVNEHFKEIFNCETISLYLKDFDFKYTDAKKSGNVKYTKLKDAEFLKCGFKSHPNFPNKFLAPLDLISVHECAQWIFKTADLNLATRENAEQSIRLAFGHGPKYFNEWKKKVNDALIREKIATVDVEWQELNSMFFPDALEYSEEGYIRIQSTGNYDVDDGIENLSHHFNPFNNKTELNEGEVYHVSPLISDLLED